MSFNHYEKLSADVYKEYSTLTLTVNGVSKPCKAKKYLASGLVQLDYSAYLITLGANTMQVPIVLSGTDVSELVPGTRGRNMKTIDGPSAIPEMIFFEIDTDANSWALDKKNLSMFVTGGTGYYLPSDRLTYII